MSGFKDDVLNILRENVLLHGEAIGWIVRNHAKHPDNWELLKYLEEKRFPVTDKETKPVIKFDYIVIDKRNLNLATLLKAFSLLANQGVVIMEITDNPKKFEKHYNLFGTLSVTRVIYEDRHYLVVHSGVDYAN